MKTTPHFARRRIPTARATPVDGVSVQAASPGIALGVPSGSVERASLEPPGLSATMLDMLLVEMVQTGQGSLQYAGAKECAFSQHLKDGLKL